MIFEKTPLPGVIRVMLQPHADARGFFARLYCPREFADAGVDFAPMQTSLSHNAATFTLRGLHYQAPPHAEAKLVRVTRGAAFDVVVDLRRDSPTYRRWHGARLDAEQGDALLIPQGCAHGFLTLQPDTDVLYQIDRMYEPGQARGVRWDDPAIGVRWPQPPAVIGAADLTWPGLED